MFTCLRWVRIGNMFAVESNSLERIVDYFSDKIPQEVPSTKAREPPASWPTSGSLVVEDFTARYSESGPAVLDGLNFSIKSGEKIGIVGRTGGSSPAFLLAGWVSYLDESFFQLARARSRSLCFV